MKNIKIPKDQVLIGVQHQADIPYIVVYNTNVIKKIQDNSSGLRGTADFYIHLIEGQIEELNSIMLLNIPYREFTTKQKFM